MRKLFVAALAIVTLASCKSATETSKYQLITPFATAETQELFETLASLQGKTLLMGQQNPLANARLKLSDEKFANCDMHHSVGDYPAVFGFDLAWGFERIIPEVMRAVEMGGIITFSCHFENPDSPKNERNAFRTQYGDDVKRILPGGENHSYLIEKLDSVASLASKIVYQGKKVPIIFRPWHEHTGGWFWWGSKASTPEEFCDLWRFTVEYLRDEKKVDNFIYAFSPSLNQGQTDYQDRNPGAEYMDIAGFDCYSFDGMEAIEHFQDACEITASYAIENNKVAACTEFGFQVCMANSENPNWYTQGVLEPIKASALSSNIVFALTWANFNEAQWWIPIPGDKTYDDFVEFYNDPYTSFLEEWNNLK